MRHKWFSIVVALLVTACERPSSLPSAPTSPNSRTAPTPGLPYELSGVVRAAGLPVEGARVTLLDFGTGASIGSTVTDGNGSYSFSEVPNGTSSSGALLSVSKPEYFTDTKYVLTSQDQTFDLERAETISVGDVIRSAIGVTARCASLGYGGGGGAVCRRFALTVPASGTLDVIVSTPGSNFDGTVLRPDGTIGVYGSSLSPLRLTVNVAAGLTYQIDVVHISGAAREFELSTTIR